MSAADSPEFPSFKATPFDSRLVEREHQLYPVLVTDEQVLRSLQDQVRLNYERACHVIERLRSSKNFSRSKLTNFRGRLESVIDCFGGVFQLLARLAADLLDKRVPNHIHHLYSKNREIFSGSLEKLGVHFLIYIGRDVNQPNSNTKIQYQHLIKLQTLLDECTTAFTATLSPLSVAFSIKLAPIVDEREAFFREQMMNVAEKGQKIAQIRNEMQEMIERRQQLETGNSNLSRMFGVLLKFKGSLGMEGETHWQRFVNG
jgi:hypothetical protein